MLISSRLNQAFEQGTQCDVSLRSCCFLQSAAPKVRMLENCIFQKRISILQEQHRRQVGYMRISDPRPQYLSLSTHTLVISDAAKVDVVARVGGLPSLSWLLFSFVVAAARFLFYHYF